jgi:hypothetical protein
MGNTTGRRIAVWHGNHDVRVESLIEGCSPAIAGGACFLSENPGTGVGRRRRLSSMELQLPKL